MYYLYEMEPVTCISQYMLTTSEKEGSLTAFDAANDEEAMDKASLYINNTLGKKSEFGISMSL